MQNAVQPFCDPEAQAEGSSRPRGGFQIVEWQKREVEREK
jgi:hypothetical protein